MESPKLLVKIRDLKQNVKQLRNLGLIPAELYGNKMQNLHLSLSANEFQKVFRKSGESTVIELADEAGNKHNVLIHDVQRHFLTSQPIHVDFLEVSMTEKITATVALEFVGESEAVRRHGGVLVKLLSDVQVESLPADLPHNIPVDISVLETLSDAIYVKDLKVSSKVIIMTPADELIVKVQPPRDVAAELAEPIVEDVTKVEGVIKPEEPTEPIVEEKK